MYVTYYISSTCNIRNMKFYTSRYRNSTSILCQIIIIFFSHFCAASRAFLPNMDALVNKYKDKFKISR